MKQVHELLVLLCYQAHISFYCHEALDYIFNKPEVRTPSIVFFEFLGLDNPIKKERD